MKSFKAFISEQGGSRGSFDTKSYIFDKYLYPALILSSTALERVFGKLKKTKVPKTHKVRTVTAVIGVRG